MTTPKTRSLEGLTPGAVVRVAGVEVGQVADLEFVGPDVKVTMGIREEMQSRITTASRASPAP